MLNFFFLGKSCTFQLKTFDNTYGILYNGSCLEKINFGLSAVRSRKRKVYYCETEEKGGKYGDRR